MNLYNIIFRYISVRPWLRDPLRWLVTRLSIHRPGNDPDIIVYATPRSGSTWLMEVLGSDQHTKFISEPFSPSMLQKAGLPTGLEGKLHYNDAKIVSIQAGSEQQFRRFLSDDSYTRLRGPYNIFSHEYSFYTDRRIIKVVYANAIAGWVDQQNLGFINVFLIRHPIPTALSMVKGCTLRARANLLHSEFRDQYLNNNQIRLADGILAGNNQVEKFVLAWCLDNLVPFQEYRANPDRWTLITYEELVLSPGKYIQYLGERLALRDSGRLQRRMNVPSASTAHDRLDYIRNESSEQRVMAWRKKISVETEKRVFDIVSEFGIDVYKPGLYTARPQYLKFSDTPKLA